MPLKLSQKWFHIALFIALSGSLIYRRFDLPTQQPVVVIAQNGSEKMIGTTVKRGEKLETKAEEFLLLRFGENDFVALDERSTIELQALTEKKYVLKFTRGRLFIKSLNETPFV